MLVTATGRSGGPARVQHPSPAPWSRGGTPMYDAIIVGGGPAGLAAALTLGRSRRRVLLLDAGQGRNAPAAAVHNLLAHDGTPPQELRRIGREQLARYPGVELARPPWPTPGCSTGTAS